jgi:LysR family cys regulon transcriptional activator
MLLDGSADIGVATEALEENSDVVAFPYHSWDHAVIVPTGHELEKVQPLTLAAIAEYPIITYDRGFTGRPRIDQAFEKAGIAPDIIMTALDADVIKAYVELGLGVGIVASVAYDAKRDQGLRLLSAEGLFERNTSRIAVRQGRYLRGYAYRFLELCSPDLTESVIRSSIAPRSEPEAVD